MQVSYTLNLNRVPKELKLLLTLLQDEGNVDEINLQDINWNTFLELVMHHRVFPILHRRLQKLNLPIDGSILQALQQDFKNNTFQMLHLSAEMQYMSRLLAERGIRSLFLKGPILATELYRDLSLRTSCDLDVLVPLADLQLTEELLIEQGYEKDDYIETVLGDWKWRHHHVTYFHPVKGIKFEVHWRLNPGPAIEPRFQDLWQRRRTRRFGHEDVAFLGQEDLFFFLVAHGARHGWSRLRWLLDIHQFVKQDVDWKKVSRTLQAHGYLQVGGQALILASSLLKTSLSTNMVTLLKGKHPERLAQEAVFYLESMINLHTEPLPHDVSVYHKKHLVSLMSPMQKTMFLISFLYPYPEDAKTLPLPKSLHFLYFPLRPAIWAWKKIVR
ncbi:nucleotidyltransferase domain-containing protein [Ectobacillus antri]|uniref:nucleotidyltransferase domain-containing protein n=1 Tax=Ectobacillus antri TaxID=2486280 RepID=UPI000F5951BB|nr:nucleotidyltransferase family protein [Ectobacillus antri]